ncbi:MAG: glycosyltransferase [Acidaminococcaceae bacterium]|nr:glycosyltransferase [Acidaminococcaceae bacterium]
MNSSPLISVIIPTFNYGAFLGACLDSVRAQTYKNIEIIVVDDGSTDATAEIAAAYPEARYVYQENSGVSAARNRGFDLSTGDFIAFIDADDYWAADKLAKQMAFMGQNPEYGIVFTGQKNFFENEKVRNNAKAVFVADREVKVAIQSALIRREVFNKHGGFKEDLRYSEDTEWVMRVRMGGVKSFLLEEILTFRRIHGENLTLRLNPLGNNCMKMLAEKLRNKRNENG